MDFSTWLNESTGSNSFRGKTFYHGTNTDFDEFDTSMVGKTDPGFIGSGFYLTGDEFLAKMYAQGTAENHGGEPVVLEFKVNPKKTLELEGTGTTEWNQALKDLGIDPAGSPEKHSRELQKLGYDSIAAWRKGKVKEFVALDPRILKRKK